MSSRFDTHIERQEALYNRSMQLVRALEDFSGRLIGSFPPPDASMAISSERPKDFNSELNHFLAVTDEALNRAQQLVVHLYAETFRDPDIGEALEKPSKAFKGKTMPAASSDLDF